MGGRRVALIASWPQRYIDEHRRWLELHGPHWDGWAHTLSPDNRGLLRKTIASHGRAHFYAYMSRGQGAMERFDTASASMISRIVGRPSRS